MLKQHQLLTYGGIAMVLFIVSNVTGQQLKGNQEDPCKVKGRVVADEVYCDRYWECVNNQPELYDCPNGLVFAGKHRGVTEGCDYPWRADYCDGKQLANGPIGTEHCDWLYGIFGHETSCTRYWTCWNGTSTEQLCIGGLLYNENAHSCDWPDNVDGCQKHPLCNDDANGNVPLGKSCNRYWQCQGGYPRLQRCPAMLVFDRHSLRCVVPPTEECDIPTTPLPLDGDAENNNVGGGQLTKDEQERKLANEGVPPLPLQGKNFQRARN
ncbi:protein obstructor-E-like [Eurosta solidaginis]|uniref:protein obstructor-E-like n=1 Tax=Eurosta solidaginis TaxID=178769 RepID=UPI00353179EA